MTEHIEVKLVGAGFRTVLKSDGVAREVGYLAERARYRAESVSGLRFGSGVDIGPVSAHGWVGASAMDGRTGRVNRGLLAKQSAALGTALHGV